jgi:hypothetical protein
MQARRILGVSLVLALVLVTAACADDGTFRTSPKETEGATVTVSPSNEPTGTESPEPTGTESPKPSESESPSEAPAPELEDGRHFGFIRSVDVAAQTMRFDLAYFLTGDEANQAAAEHGDEVPVPNDYYIVNDNPKLRTLAISPAVDVWVIDWQDCCELVQGEVQPFMDAFATKHHAWDALYQGSEAPYWVTVENGAVVKIEVQFLP